VSEVRVGVATLHDDGEIACVDLAHSLGSGSDVLRCFDDGDAGARVFGKPNFCAGFGVCTDGLDSEAVSEYCVVSNLVDPSRWELEARSVAFCGVSADKGAHLVQRHEVLDAVGKMFGDVAGVVGERNRGVARLPAAFVFKRLREIPVIERAVGLNVGCKQFVDEAVVKVEALRIGRARAHREDARPRNGEAVSFEAECLHQLHVFFIAMVVIVGDVAGVSVFDLPRNVRESVPD
jgi:hypothetical protein